jgi:hypothetical protein
VTRVSTSFNGISTVLGQDVVYQPFGQSSAMNVGNSGTVSNAFDLDGRMSVAIPGTPMERTFPYDPVGRLTGITTIECPSD